MIKLIAIDLDGTLLNSELKKFLMKMSKLLQKAAKAGVENCSLYRTTKIRDSALF